MTTLTTPASHIRVDERGVAWLDNTAVISSWHSTLSRPRYRARRAPCRRTISDSLRSILGCSRRTARYASVVAFARARLYSAS